MTGLNYGSVTQTPGSCAIVFCMPEVNNKHSNGSTFQKGNGVVTERQQSVKYGLFADLMKLKVVQLFARDILMKPKSYPTGVAVIALET